MTLDPQRTVNVAVQVLPLTADPTPLVECAIAVTPRPSMEVSGEGRGVMEGPLDRLLEIARQAHLARMEGGAEQTVTPIKIGDRRSGATIAEKVDKFRAAR
jgi:uncharacterized protein YqgV (UPF0045/DUF77 family)